MAIAIDTRNTGTKGVGGTSIQWTHTVGSGANRLLQVGATTGAATPQAISSVVWDSGGTNAALSNTVNAVTADQLDPSGNVHCGWWWLAAPISGSLLVKVTAAASCEITGGSSSWTGCAGTFNAASPQKASIASNTNPSLAVTSAVGEWVTDVWGMNEVGANTAVVGAGQTQIFNQDNGSGTSAGGGSDEVGAASVTMSWTGFTATNGAGQVCVSMIPSAGSTTVYGSSLLLLGFGN